ncbi:MAG: hypothetical protein OXU67_14420, partial [Chloroflexota bacterium]|nr:hypothetical protein [Chloroflexota bacterium]
ASPSAGDAFTGATNWFIEGVSGSGTGAYSGMFYNDDATGVVTTLPTEVGGTFDAQFDAGARMIGAFAATQGDN